MRNENIHKNRFGFKRRSSAFLVLLPLLTLGHISGAYAACGSPTGAAGEILYNSDYKVVQYCDGTYWIAMGSSPLSNGDKGDITVGGLGASLTVDNSAITYAKIQNVSAASRLLGRGSASGAGVVEELTIGSGLSLSGTTLTATGDGTGITALTGDVTASGTGSVTATIGNGKVTNAKLANMAANTIKGNNTGASAAPLDLTMAQVRTMLGTGTQSSSTYLRGDGTWATISSGSSSSGTLGYVQLSDGSGGFMTSGTIAGQQLFWDNNTKRLGIGNTAPDAPLSVYFDGIDAIKVGRSASQSMAFQGSSGGNYMVSYSAVNNAKNMVFVATTDAAHTTATSGAPGFAFKVYDANVMTIDAVGVISGNGSGLTDLNATELKSGTVSPARLGSGTASGATVLYGNNTWGTIPSGADNLGNHIATMTLRSDTNNTDDLGTSTYKWRHGYFNGNVYAYGQFLGDVADSATAPSFSFASDTNTGIWNAAADAVGITTGGTNRATLNASGLEVNGNIKTTAARSLPNLVLQSEGNVSGNDNWLNQGAYISIGEGGALSSASMHMTYVGNGTGYTGAGTVTNGIPGGGYWRYNYNSKDIYTDSNVAAASFSGAGSGLTSVDADLLDGLNTASAATGNTVMTRDGNGDTNVRYLNSSYVNMSHGASARNSDTVFYSSTDNYIRKNTAAGFRTALDVYSKAETDSWFWRPGNDGSGSGLDADRLDNIDSSQFARTDVAEAFASTVQATTFYDNDTNYYINADAVSRMTHLNLVGNLSAQHGTFTGNVTGNHGIFSGNISAAGNITAADQDLTGTTSGSDVMLRINNHNTTTSARGMRISIGPNSNPAVSNKFIIFADGDNDIVGMVQGDGVGGVQFTGKASGTYSDRRVKKDIHPTALGLDDLMKLEPVDYVLKLNGEKETGFVAQDIYKVFPYGVTIPEKEDGGNGYWRLDYGRVTPLIVKGVQDLKHEKDADIGHLKARIENNAEAGLQRRAIIQSNTEAIEALRSAQQEKQAHIEMIIDNLQTENEKLLQRIEALEGLLQQNSKVN